MALLEQSTVIFILVLMACVGGLDTETGVSLPETDIREDGTFTAMEDYIEEFGCNALVYNRTSVIHDCLKRSLHFFRKYLSRLDKDKTFDVCRRFQDVRDCLVPILEFCPVFRQKYLSTLQPIINYFKCACGGEELCMENLHCFEVEYRGIMSKRCDDYHKFNVQQKTHKSCYFLQENIACKVALVSTACDRMTGDFAFHIYRFLASHETKTARCAINYIPAELYEGFYYDDNCPTYFLQDLAACSSNHLWNQMLQFDEENDLVVRSNKHTVAEACKSYRSYRRCIRHPRKACKSGTREVFNYGTNLRKYALKMDYICKRTIKPDYTKSLPCYQDVLVNDTLKKCDYIYKDLKPWLSSVSAYQFYCKEASEATVNMKLQLNRLRSCYEDVFRLRCGDLAGATIGELIHLAFKDPSYLRYSYKPDCRLHRKRGRLKGDALSIGTKDVLSTEGSPTIDGVNLSGMLASQSAPFSRPVTVLLVLVLITLTLVS